MNPHIDSIYASRKVTGRSGRQFDLTSEIDPDEGRFLHRIIAGDPDISKTLEVGCAYGVSSLHICAALRSRANPQHTLIDPFQNSQWDGVGVKNLEDSGIGFFNLIEKRSEFALPELLQLGEATFDFIFIDGWHTFDHTLLDCFYATRLLKVGGYLVIDDVGMPSVRRAADSLSAYPCYRVHGERSAVYRISLKHRLAKAVLGLVPASKIGKILHPDFARKVFSDRHTTMIALQKIVPDERSWDWYEGGF